MKETDDILDTTLKAFDFEFTNSEFDSLFEIVMTCNYEYNFPKEQELKLFARLKSVDKEYTLGTILQNVMMQHLVTPSVLSEKTKISENMLSKLLTDSIIISNVPVVVLKRLLAYFKISFQEAKEAILRTNELLQKHFSTQDSFLISHPSFRKNNGDTEKLNAYQKGNEFFENDEAISMYLERLEELMNE